MQRRFRQWGWVWKAWREDRPGPSRHRHRPEVRLRVRSTTLPASRRQGDDAAGPRSRSALRPTEEDLFSWSARMRQERRRMGREEAGSLRDEPRRPGGSLSAAWPHQGKRPSLVPPYLKQQKFLDEVGSRGSSRRDARRIQRNKAIFMLVLVALALYVVVSLLLG